MYVDFIRNLKHGRIKLTDDVYIPQLVYSVVQQLDEILTEIERFRHSNLELENEFEDLRKYVDSYLKTLDIDDEIREIVELFIKNGYFDDKLKDAITVSTERWLREHLSISDTVVDKTLTISGSAADAKVTGDELRTKMKRCIIKLVLSGSSYKIQDYYTSENLSFAEIKSLISDTSNYVVCVYGNSKLRPQYVSTNEMMFIGLDRASSEAKILRMVITPNIVGYQTYSLVDKNDLTSYVREDYLNQLMDNAMSTVEEMISPLSKLYPINQPNVGDVLSVKFVDGMDMICEWTSGGDSKDYKLIKSLDITKDNANTNVMISEDENGNPFELSSVFIYHKGIKPVDESKKVSLKAWVCVNSPSLGYNLGYLGWATTGYFGYNLNDDYYGAFGIVNIGKKIYLRMDTNVTTNVKSDRESLNTEKINNVTVSGYGNVPWYGHIEIWGK